MLIEYGADININVCDAQKNTALHYAALFEEVDIVQTLINNGANVNCKNELGYIPLEYMEGYLFSIFKQSISGKTINNCQVVAGFRVGII